MALLAGLPGTGKLGLAAQLAHWRQHGRFPDDEADLAPAVVWHLAAQVGVSADALETYDWAGRTGRRHRQLILDHLAIAAFDDAAEGAFRRWLADDLLPREPAPSVLEAEVGAWFAPSLRPAERASLPDQDLEGILAGDGAPRPRRAGSPPARRAAGGACRC